MTEKIKPNYTRSHKEIMERLENTKVGIEHYAGQEYLGVAQDKPALAVASREKRLMLQSSLDVLTWITTEDKK